MKENIMIEEIKTEEVLLIIEERPKTEIIRSLIMKGVISKYISFKIIDKEFKRYDKKRSF